MKKKPDSRLRCKSICVDIDFSIKQVMAVIDKGQVGIAVVINKDHHLLGTITDGDIRRTILSGTSLESSIQEVLLKKQKSPLYPKPLTTRQGTSVEELKRIMMEAQVRQLPLLDEDGRVVDLVFLDDLIKPSGFPVQAIVMAGGFGTRLHPLTQETPKPMLPLGGRPVIEHIIDQLKNAGINQVHVATYHMPEKIKKHLGNGSRFGVDIDYLNEKTPLGTAGALGLMPIPTEPTIVINGDVLSGVDFHAMLDYHREYNAILTVGVRQYEIKVPYGVLECDGALVRGVREKPQQTFFVNAGIYVLEPDAYRHIPNNIRFDMTDLIQALINAECTVVSFPITEYWLDIGCPEDYQQAQNDVVNGTFSKRQYES